MTRAPAKAWLVAVAISLFAHLAILGALALVAHHVLAPTVAVTPTSPSPPSKRGPVMRVSVRSGAAHPAMQALPSTVASPTSPRLPSSRPPEQLTAPSPIEVPPSAEAAPATVMSAGAETTGAASTESSGAHPSGAAEAPSGPASDTGATGAGAATAGAGAGAGATDAPPSPVSTEVHARLASAAAGCYPAAARRFRQRGTVTIAFCVTANLTGSAPEVRQSSGLGVLDAASACVVEHAAPFPAEAARQCFTVPIRFGQ